MKVWVTETIGGFIEVDSPEKAKDMQLIAEDEGIDALPAADFRVTHREVDTWTD